MRKTYWQLLEAIQRQPEFKALCKVPQSKIHHPEGDAWKHSVLVFKAMKKLLQQQGIKGQEKFTNLISALVHDIGKPGTTVLKNGDWASPGHGKAGLPILQEMLKRLNVPDNIIQRVSTTTAMHMDHLGLPDPYKPTQKVVDNAVKKLIGGKKGYGGFSSPESGMNALANICEADVLGRHLPGQSIKLPSLDSRPFNEWISLASKKPS